MRCNDMKKLLLALALFLLPISAQAASRFWVGGAGTWDSTTTTHWSASTGGAGGASAPTTGDTITFDGSSGGGAVTVDTTINGLSLISITMGAFTGTLDFSVNNPSITITNQFSNNGAGTRTLKLGSGTFTVSSNNGAMWDFFGAGLTLTPGTATISFTSTSLAGAATVQLGSSGISYAGTTMTFAAVTNGFSTFLQGNTSATLGTLNITGPRNFTFSSAATITISNAFNWVGSVSNPIGIESASAGAAATISVASGTPTMSGAAIRSMTFTGGATFTATNSLDLKGNTGITITPPSGGGGGRIIGG